jgi:hypothetical protein
MNQAVTYFLPKTFFMQPLSEKQLHKQARKRVEFRAHLLVYWVVIGALWIIWTFTSEGYPWPVWPSFGWGIGLVFHYLFDYRPSGFLSEEEEYKKLKRRSEQPTDLVS